MSLAYNLDALSMADRVLIKTLTELPSEVGDDPEYCFVTQADCTKRSSGFGFPKRVDERLLVPMGIGREVTSTQPILFPHSELTDNARFTGTLNPQQTLIVQEAMDKLTTSTHGTCFLDVATGKGKTCLSVYLTVKLRVKTVFLCHLDIVCRQTPGEFAKFSNLRVQLVKGKRLDPMADVYIIGLWKARNLWRDNPKVFEKIGLVIVDEAHLCHHFTFTELMFCFCPRYLVGMSATPIWNKLTEQYFTDPIKLFAQKPFVVEKVVTPFVPDTSKKIFFDGRSRVDWTHAMSSLAENEERNRFILELILKHAPDHKVLVLCGRVEQCNWLYNQLQLLEVSSDLFVGRKNSYDQECNVLVAGVKKAGVGFNDPKRTALVLCFDMSDIRQSEGRIRTSNNVVFDIVDRNYTLEQHWRKRKAWYKKRGATVVEVVEGEGDVRMCEEEVDETASNLKSFLFAKK
jgi:hypothetical protein